MQANSSRGEGQTIHITERASALYTTPDKHQRVSEQSPTGCPASTGSTNRMSCMTLIRHLSNAKGWQSKEGYFRSGGRLWGEMGLQHLGKMARSWTTSTLLCRLIVQPPSYDFNRGTWNVPSIPVIADGYERGDNTTNVSLLVQRTEPYKAPSTIGLTLLEGGFILKARPTASL